MFFFKSKILVHFSKIGGNRSNKTGLQPASKTVCCIKTCEQAATWKNTKISAGFSFSTKYFFKSLYHETY